MEIFRAVGSGQLAKEAIPDVFTWLSKNEGENLKKALESLGLRMMSREQLTTLVDRVIEENQPSVEKQGGKAFGLLMGLIMKEARGRADPKLVGTLLKAKLA